MTATGTDDSSKDEEQPLSKRDWILLPLLGLLTITAIICVTEGLSRLLYSESRATTLKCLVINDPATGVRAIPNTECSQKMREGKTSSYAFNSCGHRAGMECGPKPVDTFRIVLVGSSFNFGMGVPVQQSFAALLPEQLSRRAGRKVELYNEAMQWGFPHSVDLRFKEVLAAQPDLILWPLTPMDIEGVDVTLPYVEVPENNGTSPGTGGNSTGAMNGRWRRLISALSSKSPSMFVQDAWKRFASVLNESRSVFLLQHWLFKSQSQYVKQYLMQGDATEYLRIDAAPAWRQKLAAFDKYYADVQAQANAMGTNVVVATLPERAQAAMISVNDWPRGVDPYVLGDELRSIVTRHGGTYIDILPYFRNVPNPEQMYLPVDGHPDADGHAMISRMIAEALTGGAVPALSIGVQPQNDPMPAR